MPKPILKQPQTQAQTNTILSATQNQQQKQKTQQMNQMQLDRLLRKPRSKAYLQALHRLDAGGHVQNRQNVSEIIDAIRNEFPDVDIEGILLGIVSTCYLGAPYEVHSLDITGQIIEHYQRGQVIPGGLEKVRSIAMHGGYEFIEVYVDCCRAVSSNGSVSVIPF